ncbi:MAG TPA: hybrid sensor histidine kinase/response regulator [Chloroflexia bacterium]|nr:hybrid sensor histidine kinase/response regulator [Chloroflexia bacterium]
MDDTRSALFGRFREEVDSHLMKLSKDMITLEEDPTNAALLKEIFRSAHTIKGAARMMGFGEIARVTHEMESVLGVMREGQLRLNSDISDLMFETIEVITALTQLAARPGDPQATEVLNELKPDTIVQRLKAIADGALTAEEAGIAPEPATNGATGTSPAPAPGAIIPVPGPLPTLERGPQYEVSSVTELARPSEAAHGQRPDLSAMQRNDDNVTVPVRKLDTLMNLSGEMIITKMQHQTIDDRLRSLLELERNRGRHLAGLVDKVERSWGAISQGDMEAALDQLRKYDAEVDEMTARILREFQEYTTRLNTIADELESTVLSVRMLPIDTAFQTFPLAIRNFRRQTGKEVELITRGGETELDKQILEHLSGPMIHLLGNALHHGIESPQVRLAAGKPAQGTIIVQAFPQGTQVVISVSDDGAGMDPDKLRRTAVQKNIITRVEAEKLTDEEALSLIYYPGFSTASIITDVMGRGVGMDVVKSTVERWNGSVSVDSRLGVGTTVTMRLPLTLATMQALLVRVGEQIFVMPSHTIEGGMDYIGVDDIFMIENHEVVRLRGRTMPLVRLEELLELGRVEGGNWLKEAGLQHLLAKPQYAPGNGAGGDEFDELEEDFSVNFRPPDLGRGIRLENKLPGVIVGSGERQTCFLVDELIDELDVVVKNLGPLLEKVDTAIGATILGDGRVVIILDVAHLLAESRNRTNRGQMSRAWRAMQPGQKTRILVVDDSITTRELEKSILENAGFEVEIAMDGLEALAKLEQYAQAGDHHYDLMIADIEMPRMDGLELTQRVKTHGHDMLRMLPVIIVSSLASEAYKQRGVEVGAQAYITKGQFDQGHLLETIDLLIH